MEESREIGIFYDLVDRIIGMIRESNYNREEYVRVLRVRDALFPLAERSDADIVRWKRAVVYINRKDSVATETRLERGVEYDVWKWIPGPWAGKAISESPNVPKEALSHCLKIREMFSVNNYDADIVEKNLREKLPVRPLHVGVLVDNDQALVFVMLRNMKDAKDAFDALLGEWFNSRLLIIKYVRDERYMERYPVTSSFDLED